MPTADLDSPIWRIAAATGEEPATVEASIAALVADGHSLEDVWRLLEWTLRGNGKVEDMAAEMLARGGAGL